MRLSAAATECHRHSHIHTQTHTERVRENHRRGHSETESEMKTDDTVYVDFPDKIGNCHALSSHYHDVTQTCELVNNSFAKIHVGEVHRARDEHSAQWKCNRINGESAPKRSHSIASLSLCLLLCLEYTQTRTIIRHTNTITSRRCPQRHSHSRYEGISR